MGQKETFTLPVTQEVWKLLTDVTYAQVPYWFDQSWRPLKLDLLLPKHQENHKPLPLFVWLCGGGFTVMDKDIWVPELIDIARSGFVVASVQYRTSNEAPFPAAIEDVKAAIRFLRAHAEQFCIDPEKVAIGGESAGGHLACMAGVTGQDPMYDKGDYLPYSSAVQAVVDVYGLVDVTTCLRGPEPDFTTMMLGAQPQDVPEKTREASPLLRVHPGCPPFFILHGDKDDMVDPDQSERLAKALEENGVPFEYLVLQGAGHGDDAFYQPACKERVIQFLHRVLQGGKQE